MAKFPQPSQIDYSNLPGGETPRAQLPNVDATGAAAREAANVVENIGGMAAKTEAAQQAALAKALAEKQKIVDTVNATRSAGDFEEGLRAQSDEIQNQFWDSPEKAPNEFLTRARQLADTAIKNPNNTNAVSLALAQRTAVITHAQTVGMHHWAQQRMTEKAKNDMTVMVNQATRGAEDQPSLPALEAYAEMQHMDLDPIFEHLTRDHSVAKANLDKQLATAWVTAAGARDPVGTMAALDTPYTGATKNGFLNDNLTSAERATLRRQVQTSFDGIGKRKHMQQLKEGIDLTGEAYDLFRTGELTSGTVFSLRKSLEQKKMATSVDRNMNEESRKQQLASIDTQVKTLDALDDANRKQTGFDAKDDEGTREALLKDYNTLFKENDGKAGKDLEAVVKFRQDLAIAYSGNKISRATFGTMDKGLALALPKAMTKETKTTGWALPFGLFTWRSPREAGNVVLNDLFDGKTGALGTLTPKQQSNARLFYIEQLNDATESGRNLDEASAQAMARKAAYYAAGKKLPGGR